MAPNTPMDRLGAIGVIGGWGPLRTKSPGAAAAWGHAELSIFDAVPEFLRLLKRRFPAWAVAKQRSIQAALHTSLQFSNRGGVQSGLLEEIG